MVGASVGHQCPASSSLIQASTKDKIGFLTLICKTSMGIATALASYLAVPITQAILERTYPPPHVTLSSNFFGLWLPSPL